jgi:hypothetical protein
MNVWGEMMSKIGKLPVLGFVLAAIFLPSLRAQSVAMPPSSTTMSAPTAAPAKTRPNASAPAVSSIVPEAPAANSTLAGQAPEEVMKRLSALVHARKYTEAEQLTEGLLVAYPGDSRLIKGRALLEKLLLTPDVATTPSAATTTIANNQPVQPAASTIAQPLAGMDKVDFNALIELAKQAQQTADLPEQQQLLEQFMDQSDLFLQKHPEQALLWQLRAASAISLNHPLPGYEAGQRLLAMGAADSDDANLQRLLAQLKNKGWLDHQHAEALYENQRYILVVFLGEAADRPANAALRGKLSGDMTQLLANLYPARQIRFTTPAPSDPTPLLTLTINIHDTGLSPCTYSMFKNIWQCPAQSKYSVEGTGLQGWEFNNTYTVTGGTSGVGWGTARTPFTADELNAWVSGSVLGVFKKILADDAVRAALAVSPAS